MSSRSPSTCSKRASPRGKATDSKRGRRPAAAQHDRVYSIVGAAAINYALVFGLNFTIEVFSSVESNFR